MKTSSPKDETMEYRDMNGYIVLVDIYISSNLTRKVSYLLNLESVIDWKLRFQFKNRSLISVFLSMGLKINLFCVQVSSWAGHLPIHRNRDGSLDDGPG